ncbi:hypothetical protein, partial [Motilibacter deserti]
TTLLAPWISPEPGLFPLMKAIGDQARTGGLAESQARAFQASVLTAWTAPDNGDTTGARTTLQALRATIDSAKA